MKNGKILEKPAGICGKWKNLKSGNIWNTWWKVEKSEKPGGKWKNLKNLVQKSEKPGGKWKNVKNLMESGKIWKTGGKWEKKWKNLVKVKS